MTSTTATSKTTTTTVLAAFAAGSLLSVVVQRLWNEHRKRKDRRDDLSSSSSQHHRSLPQHVRDEQLSRHTLYFGEEGMKALQNASMCVVGVGGVGSHAASMLARAGVGRLRLIDFDQVTLSSLNRHACAVLSDVGIPKVTACAQHFAEICPDPAYLTVETRVDMVTADTVADLLATATPWTVVLDAIDDVPTKAALIAYCLEHKLRVISCMGAGGKADPTRLHVSDLRTAAKDPLASKLRQSLRKLIKETTTETNGASYLDDMDRLAIVYSSEKTVVKLADFSDDQREAAEAGQAHDFGAVDGMRIRVVPVLGTMPALMGQSMAAVALTETGLQPLQQPVTGERVGKNVRNKMFQKYQRRENLLAKEVLATVQQEKNKEEYETLVKQAETEGAVVNGTWIGPLQIDLDDVEYLLQIWRNRCAVTQARLGTVLHLVRWDMERQGSCDNLVIMSTVAMEKFQAPGGKDQIPAEVRNRIEERLASCMVDGLS